MISASASIDIEALPPEQKRIDRPCPRAKHSDANGQHRQEDVNPSCLAVRRVERNCGPYLVEGNHCSHDWRPKPDKQKESADSSY
jgi:hypothetical protein